MQGHRNDYIGFIQKGPPRAIEPADEARNQIEPVGVFECQNRPAALDVVAHDSASPVEGWRIGKAGRAERLATWVQVERQSTALAGGPVKEVNVLPTSRA